MSLETIPGTGIEYGLISFGAEGRERFDDPAGRMSQVLMDRVKQDRITNVFFFCHGWKGDVTAAREQYNSWIKAFATSADIQKAPEVFGEFRPLYIGLHWPSLPWGDEELAGGGDFGAVAAVAPDTLLNRYLARLGNQLEIRAPLEIILDEARRNIAPEQLPPHVRQAYLDLNQALGLSSGDLGAPPDADREAFDPDESFEAANEESASFGGGLNLGGLLGPLRQLSYWTMKKRARTIGEGGLHEFLSALQTATSLDTRIHLMGHSFGTIVVSAMLGGPSAAGELPRPVDSVVLVQGAVSLWSYAASIPFPGAGRGYFNPIVAARKVRGPIVTTRSKWDKAVGVCYPLASRMKGSVEFAAGLPKYGGIGAFGIQGLPDNTRSEIPMAAATVAYDFEDGKVYNLDASKYICQGKGASGAHSDIAGAEVAHAIWAAAFGRGARGRAATAV
jgi:hypothetical protein